MMIDKKTGLLEQARQTPSPNHDERPDENDISLIIIHNITLPPGEFGGPWIDALFTNTLPPKEHPFFEDIKHLRVSSHLLIRRDGEIVQYVPFHKRAFHAGISNFKGREACNDFSIGIEMEGTDDTPFTDKQYDVLKETIDRLLDTYPTLSANRITGHEHIAPGRKTDPGPFFAWDKLAEYYGEKLPTSC
jgi:AmpD protein